MVSSNRINGNPPAETVKLNTDAWQSPTPPKEYYLLWRAGWSQPWQSEEIDSRNEAHVRYFALIERGYEAYLQRRRPPS